MMFKNFLIDIYIIEEGLKLEFQLKMTSIKF